MAPLYFWPQVLLNSQYNNCCCNHNGNCHCMTVKRIIWVKQKSRSHSKKKQNSKTPTKTTNIRYVVGPLQLNARITILMQTFWSQRGVQITKIVANSKHNCQKKTKRRVESKASKCVRTQHWKNIQMIHKCKDITACWNVWRCVSMCGVQLLSSLSSYSSLPTATTHRNSGMSKRH